MTRLVRRCPQCGQDNTATVAICERDGFPLFDVKPVAAGGGAAAGQTAGSAEADRPRSAENDATQRFDASTAAWLESVSNPDRVVRVWDGALVGRGDDPDVDLWPAAPSRRISRRHAFFRQRDGRWYVESAPAITNHTAVNGERLEEGEQAALSEGDHIAFADVVFIFHDQPRGGS